MATQPEQVLLITLNLSVIALMEALAKAQPSTARLAVQQLRGMKRHAPLGEFHEPIQVELEKFASIIEQTLSQNPQ